MLIMDAESIKVLIDELTGPAAKLFGDIATEQMRVAYVMIYASISMFVASIVGTILTVLFWKKFRAGPSFNSWDVASILIGVCSIILWVTAVALFFDGLARANSAQSWALRVLMGN
jgi:hypothetical protein